MCIFGLVEYQYYKLQKAYSANSFLTHAKQIVKINVIIKTKVYMRTQNIFNLLLTILVTTILMSAADMTSTQNIFNLFVTLLVTTIFMSACDMTSKQNQISYNEIIKNSGVIIDVREKNEVQEGMIKDAHWFPLSEMQKQPKEISAKINEIAK